METERMLNREDYKNGRGDKLREMTPMHHIPKPAEVAGTALFLASDDASHITGAYLVADGGYNMIGA
jgi:NAD(P)-dependent dehydrogenase (short-subunit alcohol dehydrogenase family)